MVSTRVRSQPKSSPRGSSVASTPKAGRRLTPSSVTPKKRAAPVQTIPKGKPKGRAPPKKPIKAESEGDEDVTPSERSSSDDNDSEDAFNPDSSATEEEVAEEESEASDIDSDFLDEDEEESASRRKRKAPSKSAGGSAKKSRGSNAKGKETVKQNDEDDEDPELSDVELEEGQTIAGRIYPAPTTGQVPAGRISMNTLKFLKNLQIPERNDREWFRSHEPAFRQAEKEWKAFVEKIQLKFFEADNEIPILPTKDVIHRIYRDVRFSSDKTPYKKNFSMSTSRGGRKGIWAGYYLAISPNGNSVLGAGVWQPGKDELATLRQNIIRDPQRLRDTISRPEFVDLVGPPEPHPKGTRQNVFGHSDALKVAPKLEGVDKTHKDIDLLKLRSVAVLKHFTDDEVLQPDFADHVKSLIDIFAPFVHTVNDMMTLPGGNAAAPDSDDDDNDNDDDQQDDEDDEEDDA